MSGVFLDCSLPYFWRKGLSLNLSSLIQSGWTVSECQESAWLLTAPPLTQILSYPLSYPASEWGLGSNSSPHAFEASTLLNKPLPKAPKSTC